MQHPTQIIILGGTGDLSQRKLLPALHDLFARGMLPENFNIIGLARSKRSDADYRNFVHTAISTNDTEHDHDTNSIDRFCAHVSYVAGSFDDSVTYEKLNTATAAFDTTQSTHSNRLFYLAVPPSYYGQIFSDLATSGAATEGEGSWTHILVEKPFGRDLKTAQALDTQLSELFREDQIFRIDHYLAKEAVQNILSFRFANTLLQAAWDKESVASVHINMTETIDVGDRAGFYEGVGALRDVGQNHLLQLLALVAMRQPKSFEVEAIRTERCRALDAIKPLNLDTLNESVLRAQYLDYRTNDDIPDDSQTETYFELKAEVSLPEWEGVPFYIQAGKALDTAEVSVTIKFKDIATGMFETKSCMTTGNEVKLTISPEQTIRVTLDAKAPGLGFQLETRELAFTCNKGNDEIKNSYEKVLFDAIAGDQMLFTRTDEVLAAWKFITPILEAWHELPLHTYSKGSTGPVDSIIPNN
jgi:glucose-6-phosphate 1-dehydrogenase